jgi:hypothetical protein
VPCSSSYHELAIPCVGWHPTNVFSKKVDNLDHAVALHIMLYNFARIHQTLKTTPAIAAGIADHAWKLEEIVALIPEPTEAPGGRRKRRSTHYLPPTVTSRCRICRMPAMTFGKQNLCGLRGFAVFALNRYTASKRVASSQLGARWLSFPR